MATSSKLETNTITNTYEAQRATCEVWKSQPLYARADRILRIKEWIDSNRKSIRKAIYDDFKKPAPEVDLSEIYVVLTEIKHALKHLDQWARPQKTDSPAPLLGSRSYVYFEPKGVCLIISPWNFPYNLTIGPLISALAAGNTAILKPSELAPNCSGLITRMISELFQPSEVAVFTGGKSIAQQLLQLPFDHIFFTGSPAVGKIVMEQASHHLTSVTLELGGKSPAVIDQTADLSDAAEKLVWGKFMNCGQTCLAPDYLLVHETVEEELISHLCRQLDQFFDPDGDRIESSKSYARIINEKHFDRLESILKEALDSGAEIEYGGTTIRTELYFAPTVLSEVPLTTRLMEEEIFGPVLPIVTYYQASEAIQFINSKPKPLALYIFSRSWEFKNKLLQMTSSGSVAVNDCVIQFMNPNLPFGGVNQSGIGKSHGYHGFLAFSNQKSVLKQKTGLTSVKPLFPPYTSLTQKAIDFLLKYL